MKEWLTAREIAAERLPDMPDTERGIQVTAQRLGWNDALLADEHVPVAIRDRATNAGVPCTPPRFTAGACLRVGLAMLEAGRSTDPQALGPIYPRPPEAVTLWEARYGAKD